MFQPISCKEEHHRLSSVGTFYLGRAEELIPTLAKEYAGKVQLVYLDPPFGTGDRFLLTVGRGKSKKEILAYSDDLSKDEYLSVMRRILSGCYDLLAEDGALYLHIDYRYSARFRLMLDEIFGEASFQNEIIWAYKSGGRATRYYPRKHDVILYYGKGKRPYFNIAAVGIPRGKEPRNHMKRRVDEDGRVYYSIRSGGKLYKYYEDSLIYPSDVWDDIEHLHQRDRERTGYATQKPEALLQRILLASAKTGSLVFDPFSGSGTTAAVAAKLKLPFLAVDASPVAMQVLRNRLLTDDEEISLFEDEKCLSLVFPEASTDEKIEPPFREEGEKIRLNSAEDVSFWAVGTVTDGIFTSSEYDHVPKDGATLPLPKGKNAAVEVSDLYGRTYFWKRA